QIRWRIRNRGTKNVGIRLRGNWPIGRVVTSPARTPRGLGEERTPRVTASTRSRHPSTFHTMNVLRGKGGLQYQATTGAVTPMAKSPQPAGRANAPGKTPWRYRMTNTIPPTGQVWARVSVGRSREDTNCRNGADVR